MATLGGPGTPPKEKSPFGLFLHDMTASLLQTFPADNFRLEIEQRLAGITKDTDWIVFLQNDPVTLHKDLHSITRMNSHFLPKLLGQHDPTQMVHFPNNPDSTHLPYPHTPIWQAERERAACTSENRSLGSLPPRVAKKGTSYWGAPPPSETLFPPDPEAPLSGLSPGAGSVVSSPDPLEGGVSSGVGVGVVEESPPGFVPFPSL